MPQVSVVIPMFNEIGMIEKCIGSILNQTYPTDKIEIIVVDGGSMDGSRNKVLELIHLHPNIRLYENPQRITPRSLNTGIKNAQGEIVIILGAHTTVKDDFIYQNVTHMQKMGVKCVGGTQVNVGENDLHRAIGYAMASPFGFPSAPYRFRKREKFVDTVVYAAYHKQLFDEIGYFDEELLISEDAEFNWRIRKAGYQIYYTPKIVSYYYPRRNIKELVKQLFRYGILRVNVIKKHIDAIKLVHVIPMILILLCVGLLIGGFFNSIYLLTLLGILTFYFIGIISASFAISMDKGLKYVFILPIIFISMHLSWGLGFIFGLFKSHQN